MKRKSCNDMTIGELVDKAKVYNPYRTMQIVDMWENTDLTNHELVNGL